MAKRQWITVGSSQDGWHEVAWEAGKVRVRVDDANGITDVWIAEPTAAKLRRLPLPRIQAAVTAFGEMLGGEPITNPRYRLKRPRARRLPDTFYANVANAYRDAVRRGMQPRKTLAADTGAADATVATWIMEARKRGYLPPAEPGKVSA